MDKILMLGFLLDGNLSYREFNRLHKLKKQDIITFTPDDIKKQLKDFHYGRELNIFMKK